MASNKHARVSTAIPTLVILRAAVVLLLVVGQSDAVPQRRSSEQISRCSDVASPGECGQRPKCRWCRSELLDDMCFSYSEAWRLPPQVFSCVL